MYGELYKLLQDRANLWEELIILLANSELEADVVLAKKKTDNYLSTHSTVESIIVVAEIFDRTLQCDSSKQMLRDRETKLFLYAKNLIITGF